VHPELKQQLEDAGRELRARHDDAVIADVIGEVEQLDSDSAALTADLLRTMAQTDEE
jgi:hypothetical protein